MNFYLISDTHFNHAQIATYCQRPEDFSEKILNNLRRTLQKDDVLIHLGDVFIGEKPPYLFDWPGKTWMVRGNHDRKHSCAWWVAQGAAMCVDAFMFRHCWLTHEPAPRLPFATQMQRWHDGQPTEGELPLNIHGHLHNIWHGFHRHAANGSPENLTWVTQKLAHPWQRLFAVEYTQYNCVEFQKFVDHPDRYQARGPQK